MRRNIRESVAVITGASSGIGRATAYEFARRGANVVVAARRQEALDKVVLACERIGGRALAVPTDVTREDDVRRLAKAAVKRFGRVDVWVNNAAVTVFARFEETPREDFRRVIETNFFGYVYGARAVMPHFREQGGGVLINISSVVGAVGQAYTSAYVASKYAIRGLSETLSQELSSEKNIRVCTIFPAVIDTPLFQQGANYTGWVAKAPRPVYPPEQVAETIVNVAESPRKEVFVGFPGRLAPAAKAVVPSSLFDKAMRRNVEMQHFKDEQTNVTTGNLYSPMPEWARITGGWQEEAYEQAEQRHKKMRTVGIAAAGIGALALILFLRKRKSKP